MELIQTITLNNSTTASFDFNSIPDIYDDLLMTLSGRGTIAQNNIMTVLYINGNTSNGIWRQLFGTGTGVSYNGVSGYIDAIAIPAASSTSNTFGSGTILIPGYKSSVAKTLSMDYVTENNGSDAIQAIRAVYWNSTAAITQLGLAIAAGNYVQNTTASLYGMKRGSGGATVS